MMIVDTPFDYMNIISKIPDKPELKNTIEPLRSFLIQVYPILEDSHNLDHGLLLGILGDWGTGKTSLLKALQGFFEDYMGYPTVFFDAWKYQEDPHPLIPLISKIKEKARGRTKGNLSKALKTVAQIGFPIIDFGLKVITTRTIGTSYGLKDIKKIMEEAGDYFIEYSSVYEKSHSSLKKAVLEFIEGYRVEKNENEKQLWKNFIGDVIATSSNTNEKYLVILVDDLDRLLPKKALRIFELLRFYLLDIPRTIVIMAINDRILIPAIEKQFELHTSETDPGDLPGGRDFMEKVFHWTFEIPFVPWGLFGDYLRETVFGELGACRFWDQMREMFAELDPLSFRKWVRIKNRILAEKNSGRIKGFGDIWICALKECFPSTEWYLRDFPAFEEKLRTAESLEKVEEIYKDKLNELGKKAKEDTSVFKRSAENWDIFLSHR